MIRVTRLDDSMLMLNAERIQSLKETPDTIITFTDKASMMVKESVEELSGRIIEYHRSIHMNPMINSEIFHCYPAPIN